MDGMAPDGLPDDWGPPQGQASQQQSIAADGLPDDWGQPVGQAQPSLELAQHLQAASQAAGRPVSAWQIGENEPGQTPSEMLPVSVDQGGNYHWAVPGFIRGAASAGMRLAGNEPWTYGENASPRQLEALWTFGRVASPAREMVPVLGESAPATVAPAVAPTAPFEGVPPRPAAGAPQQAVAPAAPPGAPAPPPPAPAAPRGPAMPPPPRTPQQIQAETGMTFARAARQSALETDMWNKAQPPAQEAPGPSAAVPVAGSATQGAPVQPTPTTATTFEDPFRRLIDKAPGPPPAPPPAPGAPPIAEPGAPPAPAAPPPGVTSPGAQAAAGAAGAALPALGIPQPPPAPRPISQIQTDDNVSAHTATQLRRIEEGAWHNWHSVYAPNVPVTAYPPAGFPTPDAQMKQSAQDAAVNSPMTADEIAQGANYPVTAGQVQEIQPYLPEGFVIQHVPGQGWGLYGGPGGTLVPGTLKVAPSGQDIHDMAAAAQAIFQGQHAPPHPSQTTQGAGTVVSPVQVQKPSDIHAAAVQAVEPTPGQAAAGNQRKGHIVLGGVHFAIETGAGEMRRDKAHVPPRWEVQMPADYGYAKRSEGADGDAVDVYFGPRAHEAPDLPVFVVDQRDANSLAFDEHKVMIGFPSLAAARTVYQHAFNDGLGNTRLGAISQITWAEFRRKLAAGEFKKAHAYRSPEDMVRAAMAEMGVKPSERLINIAVGTMAKSGGSPQSAVLNAVRIEAKREEEALQRKLDEDLAKARAAAAKLEADLAAKGKPGTKWATDKGKPENERQPSQPGSAAGEQPAGPIEQPAGPHPAAAPVGAAGGAEPAGGQPVSGAPAEQPVRPGAGAGGQHRGEQPAAGAEPGHRPEPGAAGGAAEAERPTERGVGAGAESAAGRRAAGEGGVAVAPDWAQQHADDLRGQVVWHEDRIALIRGYSLLSGQPLYAGVVREGPEGGSSLRTRIDISKYQGSLFTKEELDRLLTAKKSLVGADKAAFDARPKGPFEEGRVAHSRSVDVRLAQYARSLSQMVGLGGVRIFIADPADMRAPDAAETYGLNGPYAAISSSALQDIGGSVRRLSNGAYYIAVSKNVRKSGEIEAIAHEIGHILQREAFEKAEKGEKDEIQGAFGRWLKQHEPDKVSDYVKALRAHTTGKTLGAPGDLNESAKLPAYWRSFAEWFADQVAKWATSDEKALSLLDKLFDRIAQGYRKLAKAAAGERYKPDALMARWLSKQDGGMAAEGEAKPPESTGPPAVAAEPEPAPAPAEEPAPEAPASTWEDLKTPERRIADFIDTKLRGNDPITMREVIAAGNKAFGGSLAEGTYTRDQLHDAMELGVNLFISHHSEGFRPDIGGHEYQPRLAWRRADALAAIKDRLPTQTVRAGEKDAYQQFSTPPDYAWAAAWVANLQPDDVVLEPSAGTGSLAVHALNADVRKVWVNELSAKRVAMLKELGLEPFSEDAEQLDNILPDKVKPSVVLMNPPFSRAAERMGDRMVLGTDARHIEEALKRLVPGGRLVAIVGRGFHLEGGRAPWFTKHAAEFTIRANVGVSGKVYAKYGTSFDTRLIVVDKVPSAGQPATVTGDVPLAVDLITKLKGVRNERREIEPPGAGGPGEQPAGEPAGAPVAEGGEGGARPGGGVSAATGDLGTGAGGEPEPAAVAEPAEPGGGAASAPAVAGGRPGGRAAGNGVVAAGPEPVAAGAGGSAAGPAAVGGEPAGRGGEVAGPRPVANGGEQLKPDVVTAALEAAVTEPDNTEITESVYEPYKPQRVNVKGAKAHPGALVQSAAMATVTPPETTYAPTLPKGLLEKGALSDAQMEAIVYAGHAHSQMLETKSEDGKEYRRGYFIGDGTGVGKGREVAGIILDNWLQGRKKAVWITETDKLINDARRDWGGIGQDPEDVFNLGKTKAGDTIKGSTGILFTTYDTLKSAEQKQGQPKIGAQALVYDVTDPDKSAREGTILAELPNDRWKIKINGGETEAHPASAFRVLGKQKGKTRLQQVVDWLGKDFDGVIAFDEAHNMGNAVEIKGERGKVKPSQKALAGVDLQKQLPNARIVYVSATGATEVSNLGYADRLGLWGKGTAFPDRSDFLAKISSGGIAAMELVARDMKALGHYVARNLSYQGVEYDRVEHTLTDHQREIYDKLAEGWQVVLKRIKEALEVTGVTKGGETRNSRAKANAMAQFWGSHQRFFNQVITAMQMPTVLKAIEKDLAEGRQAVLQLVNTMEAAQGRAIEKARENDGDLEDLDMTPRDQLMQMIEKSFPVVQNEEYEDEEGVLRSRPVTDSEGNIVFNKEAIRMREKLLDEVGSLRVPDGPLEILFNHFGVDKVAEVTGRGQRVVKLPNDEGQMRTVVEKRGEQAGIADANAFQTAQKPILVFSMAGATGRSYHAENGTKSAGKRRSHYLVQAGWRADKAVQGFGRTHRTNQASAPIFHLVTTDLQGQKRFISSIARRLAQLGALTKGERRTGDQGMFGAKDNLESTEAKLALRAFVTDLINGEIQGMNLADFEEQTGLVLADDNGAPKVPEMTQFLNRLLSLTYAVQNKTFDEFGRRLDDAVEAAAAKGTLDTGTETLKADKIEKATDQVVFTDPKSGAETRHVQLVVHRRNHPTSFERVMQREPEGFVQSNRSGKMFALTTASSGTDSAGNIVPTYRLTGVNDYHYIDKHKVDYDPKKNWTRVKKEDWQATWDKEMAATPEFSQSDLHVITGAVLPIWDRLGGNPKIFRLQTDKGEKMLARVIDAKSVDKTLKALGAERAKRTFTDADVLAVIRGGGTATLANDWRIKRSLVANQKRIELVGPDWKYDREMRDAGVFSERISYVTRYFIPGGDKAAAVLAAVTKGKPVVSLERPDETEVQELRSARGEAADEWTKPESWDDVDQDNPDAPWFHQMARPPQPPWNPDLPVSRKVEDYLAQLPIAGNALGTVAGKFFDITDMLQMAVAPMASVKATETSRNLASDFANRRRFIRWVAGQAVDGMTKEFTPDRLAAMWEAADVESVAEQAARITAAVRPAMPVPGGFASLSARELQVVRDAMAASEHAFQRAVAAGLIDPEAEIPFYVPRIIVQIGSPDVKVVKDIRTLVLSTMQINEAVIGKMLINRIEAAGRIAGMQTVSVGGTPNIDPWRGVTKTTERLLHREHMTVPELERVIPHLTGDDGSRWFTLEQNAAFKKWTVIASRADGSPVWIKQPIYVRGDFEGPLKAVLRRPTDKLTREYMALKGRMMTSIMYGITHLAVIAGRALPVTKSPIPIKFMREGGVAMHDQAIMRRAIEIGGMDPIGKRWAFRGEQGDAGDLFDLRPGRSWTAQILGLLVRPLGANVSEAAKRAVDKAGDWAHNRMLWERVGALQAGLYLHFERERLHKGDSPAEAAKFAGHMANRWAGALPAESMSKLAADLANWFLFSRTYRLGNLGTVKDAILGPPKGTQAMIGAGRRRAWSRSLRRTMALALAIDLLIYNGVGDLMQSVFDLTTLDRPLTEEMAGYGRRLEREGKYLVTHPWQMLNPGHMLLTLPRGLGPMSEHEPGKENRILVGFEADGTGIYIRPAWGKFVEDVSDYLEAPIATVKSALSPVARTVYGLFSNDAGFGRPVYDPYWDADGHEMRAVGDIALYMAENSGPATAIKAAGQMLHGNGNTAFNAAQIVGGGLGFSFSHGYPGGPEKGFEAQARRQNDYEEHRAMPGWRDQIKTSQALMTANNPEDQVKGQEMRRETVIEMRKLGMRPAAISGVIRFTLHPSNRGRDYQALRRTMTEDQAHMMDVALQDMVRHQQPSAPQ